MTCGVTGCDRQIVRGPLGHWAHLTNPGRDHHYARPASRPGQEAMAGLEPVAGDPGQPEGSDWAGSLNAPAAAVESPPESAAAVRISSVPFPLEALSGGCALPLSASKDAGPDPSPGGRPGLLSLGF